MKNFWNQVETVCEVEEAEFSKLASKLKSILDCCMDAETPRSAFNCGYDIIRTVCELPENRKLVEDDNAFILEYEYQDCHHAHPKVVLEILLFPPSIKTAFGAMMEKKDDIEKKKFGPLVQDCEYEDCEYEVLRYPFCDNFHYGTVAMNMPNEKKRLLGWLGYV